MSKPKIALLIDLGSLRITCEGFKKLYAQIEADYEIAFVKFYSYVAKRNRDFNEYIAAKGYDAVTPVASRRRNRLDTRQIIDGTRLCNSTLDAIAFAFGEGDILPIITELKSTGKEVIEIGVEKCAYSDAFNDFQKVDVSWLRDGYAAPTKKKEKAPKKVVEPKRENKYVEQTNAFFQGSSILSKYSKK